MADKSPKKPMAKKPGMSIKEKRAAKKSKQREAAAPTLGLRQTRPGN